jgi:hypothetical protein
MSAPDRGFLLDLVWIVLARMGVEPADSVHFFDDWSHSLLSTIVLATVFSLLFWRRGWAAVVGLWLVVFSHFVLDFPVHPKTIAAYPLGRLHLGAHSWIAWGSQTGWFGWNNDWWLQLAVLLLFLAMYTIGRRRHLSWKVMAASCVALIGLQLITLAPCVGY